MTTTTVPAGLSLEIRRTFHAPREAVYAAWTEREQLEAWMCRDVPTQEPKYTELDARPGGRYAIEIRLPDGALYIGKGVFRELRPPEKLVFTWSWKRVPEKPGEDLQRSESLITIELFERDGATEMVFVHAGLESERTFQDHAQGWDGCFAVLDRILQG